MHRFYRGKRSQRPSLWDRCCLLPGEHETTNDVYAQVGIVLLILLALLYLKRKSKKLFKALSSLMPPPRPYVETAPQGMMPLSPEEWPTFDPGQGKTIKYCTRQKNTTLSM